MFFALDLHVEGFLGTLSCLAYWLWISEDFITSDVIQLQTECCNENKMLWLNMDSDLIIANATAYMYRIQIKHSYVRIAYLSLVVLHSISYGIASAPQTLSPYSMIALIKSGVVVSALHVYFMMIILS